jgi:hypothetical protein
MNFSIDIQLKWIYNMNMIQKGSESKIENTEKDPDNQKAAGAQNSIPQW